NGMGVELLGERVTIMNVVSVVVVSSRIVPFHDRNVIPARVKRAPARPANGAVHLRIDEPGRVDMLRVLEGVVAGLLEPAAPIVRVDVKLGPVPIGEPARTFVQGEDGRLAREDAVVGVAATLPGAGVTVLRPNERRE